MPPYISAIFLLAIPILSACAPMVSFDAYEGGPKPDSELAIVAERDPTAGIQSISKDGAVIWQRKSNFAQQADKGILGDVDRQQVRLQPGRYRIDSVLWCNSAYAFEISGNRSGTYLGMRHTDEVELAAGHIYEIQGENTGYLCREGPKLWIEDMTAGGKLMAISSNEQVFRP